ncbi:MAG: hypothetical protein QW534_02330 [Candidatus Methanomethylicia archaeon]
MLLVKEGIHCWYAITIYALISSIDNLLILIYLHEVEIIDLARS